MPWVSGMLITLLCWGGFANASTRVPDDLKAGYIFNIAKLVEWPTSVLPEADSSLILCATASDGVTRELQRLAAKPINQRRVQIVALGARSDADFCHLVFIDHTYSKTWFRHHPMQPPGQLTIGEHAGFLAAGGVINLYVEQARLRFEISLRNAQAAGISINARLLKLARVVDKIPHREFDR